MLTKEQLIKLNTKRLLAYYRSIRAKEKKWQNRYYCESCHDLHFPTSPDPGFEALRNHIVEIKNILDLRENVMD